MRDVINELPFFHLMCISGKTIDTLGWSGVVKLSQSGVVVIAVGVVSCNHFDFYFHFCASLFFIPFYFYAFILGGCMTFFRNFYVYFDCFFINWCT